MPKRARELSARTVASLRGDGRYAVGLVPGLYLRIEGASRTWVLRVKRKNKRPERGLGSYPSVSLAMPVRRRGHYAGRPHSLGRARSHLMPLHPRQPQSPLPHQIHRQSSLSRVSRPPPPRPRTKGPSPSSGALEPISQHRKPGGSPRSTRSNGLRPWKTMHSP